MLPMDELSSFTIRISSAWFLLLPVLLLGGVVLRVGGVFGCVFDVGDLAVGDLAVGVFGGVLVPLAYEPLFMLPVSGVELPWVV